MSFFVNTMVCGFSLYQILAFFLIYSCLGWCLEVIYAAVSTGQLVNRGFLNGPVCPIYGFGMIIVLFTLSPLADNLLLLYIGGVILPSGRLGALQALPHPVVGLQRLPLQHRRIYLPGVLPFVGRGHRCGDEGRSPRDRRPCGDGPTDGGLCPHVHPVRLLRRRCGGDCLCGL